MQHRPAVHDLLSACVSETRAALVAASASSANVAPDGGFPSLLLSCPRSFVDALGCTTALDGLLAPWAADSARGAIAAHARRPQLSGTAQMALMTRQGQTPTPPVSQQSQPLHAATPPTPSPPQQLPRFQPAPSPPAYAHQTQPQSTHAPTNPHMPPGKSPSPAGAQQTGGWGATPNQPRNDARGNYFNGASSAAAGSAACAGASSVAAPSSSGYGGNNNSNGGGAPSFDRTRDARERDQVLRNAEQSGWAAPKPAQQQRPGSANMSDSDSRNKWDRSAYERGGGDHSRDRDRHYEDAEGDERAPRYRKARTESPSPPPPATSLAGAAAVAGANPFVSGNAKLADDMTKKYGSRQAADAAIKRQRDEVAAAAPKSLGGKRAKFTPPYRKTAEEEAPPNASANGALNPMLRAALAGPGGKEGDVHPKLAGLDTKLVEMITNEMMESPGVSWNDIAGLEFAKKSVREIVVWPILRPELFTGLRGPPKGLLLFGPPGTGKTLIGKAIASESKSRFFSISASSLTSKWHGEGEKLVRTLFAVAQVYEPSIIFIDEIDSLLSQRQESEFEASRRIKTEFLIQLDGASTTGKERVLVVGATNRPQELDEAARRRLVKKLYIPLPDYASRMQLLRITMAKAGVDHRLAESDFVSIVQTADGYSGSDMAALCTEASMGPIRQMSSMMDTDDLAGVDANDVRAIEMQDFDAAFQSIRPSVNQKDLTAYVAWNSQYGSFPMSDGAEVGKPGRSAASRMSPKIAETTTAETKDQA